MRHIINAPAAQCIMVAVVTALAWTVAVLYL